MQFHVIITVNSCLLYNLPVFIIFFSLTVTAYERVLLPWIVVAGIYDYCCQAGVVL